MSEASENERLIKKYPNRRLYDTQDSRYITLDDARQMVLDAEPFKVVDQKTGEDLTRSILLQIIMEQESQGEPLFNSEILAEYIVETPFWQTPVDRHLTAFEALDRNAGPRFLALHSPSTGSPGPGTDAATDTLALFAGAGIVQ